MLLRQAAKDDVVLSTTGAPRASVIITACLMRSAAVTTNLNAPHKTHVKGDVEKASKEVGCVAATPTA